MFNGFTFFLLIHTYQKWRYETLYAIDSLLLLLLLFSFLIFVHCVSTFPSRKRRAASSKYCDWEIAAENFSVRTCKYPTSLLMHGIVVYIVCTDSTYSPRCSTSDELFCILTTARNLLSPVCRRIHLLLSLLVYSHAPVHTCTFKQNVFDSWYFGCWLNCRCFDSSNSNRWCSSWTWANLI